MKEECMVRTQVKFAFNFQSTIFKITAIEVDIFCTQSELVANRCDVIDAH